jgi:hypothetical protein
MRNKTIYALSIIGVLAGMVAAKEEAHYANPK